MQEKRVKLPALSRPFLSSQISDVEEYRRWQQVRKKAYRAQLDRQVLEHRRGRELSLEQKTRERANVSAMVSQQQSKRVNSKYMKIKTEQKYMQDNFRLMKQPIKSLRKQWSGEEKEHPFVKMVEEQQLRRKSTKNSFIFQNQLNDLQSEMKRSLKKKNKEIEQLESKKYVDYVEEEFRKHDKNRIQFEKKYLQIDESHRKRDHLESLKEQIGKMKYQQNGRSRGRSPLEEYRLKEIRTMEKQIKNVELPITHHYNIEPHFSFRKQYDVTIKNRPSSYQKVVTQRSASGVPDGEKGKMVTERAESTLNVSNSIKYRGNMMNPEGGHRYFKHYDIISNSEKVVVK